LLLFLDMLLHINKECMEKGGYMQSFSEKTEEDTNLKHSRTKTAYSIAAIQIKTSLEVYILSSIFWLTNF